MTQKDHQPFDFRESSSNTVSLSNGFDSWKAKIGEFFAERWSHICPQSITVSFSPTQEVTYGEFTDRIQSDVLATGLNWNSPNLESVIVIETSSACTLVLAMLNDSVEVGEDRELTEVESSLFELVMQEFSESLIDAWQGESKPKTDVGNLVHDVKRSKLFPVSESMLKAEIQIQLGDSSNAINISWLMRKQDIETIFTDARPKTSNQLAEQIKTIPIDIRVLLGQAEMSMNQLSHLNKGDVILLDQTINEPITAFIEDEPFLTGWPGRTGFKQSVQVKRLF